MRVRLQDSVRGIRKNLIAALSLVEDPGTEYASLPRVGRPRPVAKEKTGNRKDITMGRPVVHWEFWSQEPQKTSDFYAKVFDWDINHIPQMDYHLVQTGGTGGINGGIFKPKEGKWPASMSFYIDVDDLDAYAKRVLAAGGKIIIEKHEVPGVGTMSMFLDPDDRPIGMWKRSPQMASSSK